MAFNNLTFFNSNLSLNSSLNQTIFSGFNQDVLNLQNAAVIYSSNINPGPTPLFYTDGSSFTGWTTSGSVSITVTDGVPAPSFLVPGNTYAYINPSGLSSLLNTTITLNMKVTPTTTQLVNFYFACDSNGNGQMLRLESRPTYKSGFSQTLTWTSWAASSTQPYVSSGVWYNVKIQITSSGYATWYLNGTVQDQNYLLNTQGTYIGLVGDLGGGGVFDNIKITPGIL